MRKDSIKVDNISFKYPQAQSNAVHSVSFNIKENEWIAIVGRNGSGKSTLAKLLNGLILPEEGQIVIDEEISLSEETIWDVRKKIAMVFQNPDNQFVGTTVIDDIAFGLENHGIESIDELVNGSTGLVFVGNDDVVGVCKILSNFSKENQGLSLRGAVLNEKRVSAKQLEAIAKLPSKEVLLVQAIMTMAAPLTGFVAAANNIISKFVWAVAEIKKKKEAE